MGTRIPHDEGNPMAKKQQTEVASTEVAIPEIGEVVNLADPDSCALAYDRLDVLGKHVSTLRRMIGAELVRHAEEYGANRMRLDHAEVTVSKPTEVAWDMTILAELKAAGLPEARWNELVETTVDTKVKAIVANAIGNASPAYKAIIDRARIRHAKAPTVSVALRAPVVD